MGALAATGVLAALRLGFAGTTPAASLDDLVPALIAWGFLCVVGLARRDHPTVAWLATIGAAAVVTIDLAAYVRSVRTVVDADGWRWLSIGVSLSALLGVGASAAYAASRPRLPGRWVAGAGLVACVAVAAARVWAGSNPSDATITSATGSPLGSLGLGRCLQRPARWDAGRPAAVRGAPRAEHSCGVDEAADCGVPRLTG